jgi:lipoprotein-releasing system permease protein
MSLTLFVSWRYLVAKRKEKFISLISVISVLGVAIGVMALIVVIAVMTGFDRDLRDRIIGNYAHITVSAFRPLEYPEYEKITAELKGSEHIKAISPYIQAQVLIEQDKKFMALGIKGIDPEKEKQVTKISEYITKGDLKQLKDDTVVVGRELAIYLGLNINSVLKIYSPLGDQHDLRVVGIFSSGMYDYDFNLIIVPLETAQKILGMKGQLSALAIRLDNVYLAESVKKQILSVIGYDYLLKTWIEANRNFFAALKLEKLTMFIILTLIILVACFNIISTLIVMVVEKTKDIGILKALGMNSSRIRNIFTCQGLLIGCSGVFLGTIAGVLACLLLKKYQFIKLPQDIYYIDRLPVALEIWPDMALIVLAALAITLVSTIYPAAKAAGLKPVEALRYE